MEKMGRDGFLDIAELAPCRLYFLGGYIKIYVHEL